MTEQDQPRDWDNLRFRPRSRLASGTDDDNTSARFGIAIVVFIVVVLAYPWYSYWVQAKLLERDLNVAAEQLVGEAKAAQGGFERQLQAQRERQIAMTERRRQGAVRVVGASVSRGMPVVIVQLGNATLEESMAAVCRQSELWLGQSTSGKTLRVQRSRGSSPAVEAGTIRC